MCFSICVIVDETAAARSDSGEYGGARPNLEPNTVRSGAEIRGGAKGRGSGLFAVLPCPVGMFMGKQ